MAKRGRKKKPSQFKVGDKVTCTKEPGTWELVWYQEGDDTCGIQNTKYRMLAKVNQLTLV
jgi:hypothetical protein|tara:strand:- start:240 stop:419 length:180 start_codon:yes stop_codon:yes gene_type:complete